MLECPLQTEPQYSEWVLMPYMTCVAPNNVQSDLGLQSSLISLVNYVCLYYTDSVGPEKTV